MGELLLDGVKAMILGIGMVMVFLIVMIFLMNVMAKLLKPYANLLQKPEPATKKTQKATNNKSLSEADKISARAAIEAVKMHRGMK